MLIGEEFLLLMRVLSAKSDNDTMDGCFLFAFAIPSECLIRKIYFDMKSFI